MADTTNGQGSFTVGGNLGNNPTSTAGSSSSYAGAPPSRASSDVPSQQEVDQLNTTIKSLSGIIASIAKDFADLKASIDDSAKSVENASQKTQRWKYDIKTAVDSTDDMKKKWKAINEATDKFAKNGINGVKSVEELQDALETLQSMSKDIAKKGGVLGKEGQMAMQAHLKTTTKILKEVKKAGEAATDPKNLTKWGTELRKRVNEHQQLITMQEKLTKGGKGLVGVYSNLSNMMKNPRVFEKYINMGRSAHEYRKARVEHRKDRHGSFEQNRAHLEQQLKKKGILTSAMPMKENGRIDYKQLRADLKSSTAKIKPKNRLTSEEAQNLAGQLSGRKNNLLGKVDRYLGGRVLKNMAAGGQSTGIGAAMLSRGGGSVLRGAGSLIEGVGGEGIASLGSLAGSAAPILGALELVKIAFDKQAHVNSGIEKALGGAGIFTNRGSAVDNLSAVEGNLMPRGGAGFYNSMGRTYEKNLAIAKAMADSGLTTTELNRTDQRPTDDSETGPGGYGHIAKTVYTTGRLAGFDSAQTVSQIVKMVSEYNQSLSSTHEFFVTLAKDSQAAGVGTLKYVQILDYLTAGFDRMNKSFDFSINLLRTLGKAGQMSAEDMKQYSSALTSNTQSQNVPLRTFLMQGMMSDPGQREAYMKGRAGATSGAQQQAYNSLQALGLGGDFKADGSDIKDEDIAKLEAQISDIAKRDGGSVETQSAGRNLRVLKNMMDKQAIAANGSAMGIATSLDATGQDGTDETTLNLHAYKEVLKRSGGYSFADMFDAKKRQEILKNPLVTQGLAGAGGLGLNATQVRDLPEVFQQAGLSALQDIQGGKMGEGMSGEIWDKVAEKKGLKLLPGQTKAQALQTFSNATNGKGEKVNQAFLAEFLPGLETVIMQLIGSNKQLQMTQGEKDAADNKSRELNVASTDSSEIFANAFEHLFMLIVKPLDYIQGLLGRWFGKHDSGILQGMTDKDRAMVEGSRPQALAALEELKNQRDTLPKDAQGRIVDNQAYQSIQDRMAKLNYGLAGNITQSDKAWEYHNLADSYGVRAQMARTKKTMLGQLLAGSSNDLVSDAVKVLNPVAKAATSDQMKQDDKADKTPPKTEDNRSYKTTVIAPQYSFGMPGQPATNDSGEGPAPVGQPRK